MFQSPTLNRSAWALGALPGRWELVVGRRPAWGVGVWASGVDPLPTVDGCSVVTLKWKRASQRGVDHPAAASEPASFGPSRGIVGTQVARLAKRLEREICEQLLHFSRAVGEP